MYFRCKFIANIRPLYYITIKYNYTCIAYKILCGIIQTRKYSFNIIYLSIYPCNVQTTVSQAEAKARLKDLNNARLYFMSTKNVR